MSDLVGIPIRTNKYLPKTIKDADGRELPLLGVLASGVDDFFSIANCLKALSGEPIAPPRMTLLVEDS